jgi:hypothetical protein
MARRCTVHPMDAATDDEDAVTQIVDALNLCSRVRAPA